MDTLISVMIPYHVNWPGKSEHLVIRFQDVVNISLVVEKYTMTNILIDSVNRTVSYFN